MPQVHWMVSVAVSLCASCAGLGDGRIENRPIEVRLTETRAVDQLASEVYSIVSGPAGQDRDWDRYRALFRDDALLVWVDPGDRESPLT